jgi:hypothetical protein
VPGGTGRGPAVPGVSGGGVRRRHLPRRRWLRRADLRLLGGGRPVAPHPARGRAMPPRVPRSGRPPSLRDPGGRISGQELPDGVRTRLRVAKAQRGHAPATPGGPRARGPRLRGTRAARSKPRKRAGQGAGISGGPGYGALSRRTPIGAPRDGRRAARQAGPEARQRPSPATPRPPVAPVAWTSG